MTYGKVFSALADPTRRQIFEALRKGPQSVGALAEKLPVSRPAVSQHLKVLESAGLTLGEAQGNRRVYGIRRDGLKALQRYLESFWTEALDAYAAELEKRLGPKK